MIVIGFVYDKQKSLIRKVCSSISDRNRRYNHDINWLKLIFRYDIISFQAKTYIHSTDVENVLENNNIFITLKFQISDDLHYLY